MTNNIWKDCGKYWELMAPQGHELWLTGRLGRITTSVSCAMAGKSRFKSVEDQGLIIKCDFRKKIIAGAKQEVFTDDEMKRMNHGSFFEKFHNILKAIIY